MPRSITPIMEYNEKQLQILEVAEKLFAANGFDGTSIRDIASEAEVNIAMISYYFGSKEKLMEALFMSRYEQIKLQLENIVKDEKLGPLEKVYALVDNYVGRAVKKHMFHKVLAREQMSDKDSPLTKMMYEMKCNNQALVKTLIHEGQKKGVFRKHVDIPMLMSTLVGTANQLITAQHFYKEINNLQDMEQEEFNQYLLKKLSAHLKNVFKLILTNED